MNKPILYETIWHGIPLSVEYTRNKGAVTVAAIRSKLDHSVVVLSLADTEELKRKCGRHFGNIVKEAAI